MLQFNCNIFKEPSSPESFSRFLQKSICFRLASSDEEYMLYLSEANKQLQAKGKAMANIIAETIIEQLGGVGRLVAMIGVGQIVVDDSSAMFGFKGCRKANKCRITLTPMDLYKVEFFKLNRRSLECPIVEEFDGVYGDQLVEIFESTTGLFLSL